MFGFFKRTSPRRPKSTPTDAVYDFLYCDARRVASFLAQFNPAGHLTSQRLTVSEKGSRGSTAKLGGGLAAASLSGSWNQESAQQAEGTYDPFWVSAISLLQQLTLRGLLKTDLGQAGVGELVLATGSLKVLNLHVAKSMLNNPALAQKFGLGGGSQLTQDQIAENALTLEFVKVMPHTIQAQFIDALNLAGDKVVGNNIWMTLDPASMVVPAEDVLLKYGLSVSGTWKLLAIKDASPDEGAEIDFGLMSSIHALNYGGVAEARGTTTIALFSEVFSPVARKLLGRPGAFHGATPIMIFREIGPAATVATVRV